MCTAHCRQRIISVIADRFTPDVLFRIAQSAVAAGLAWELALQIPNHGQPFFAPIAAVIALAADRGRRGRQALDMMVGVALGIVIGAGLVAVAGAGGWQIAVGTAIALVVATAVDASPLIRTQAAASTILVVALHVPGTNLAWQRLIDALIGGGIAIVMARFLFPVDPLDLVRTEAVALRAQLADRLDAVANALEAHDPGAAERARAAVDALDDRRLVDALATARTVVRAAPRRRPLRRRLDALGRAWNELQRSVDDSHAIAAGALRLARSRDAPPPTAAEAVRATAAVVRETDPASLRKRADVARAAARRLLEEQETLAAGVLAHGVSAVADHATAAAEARDEDRRLREEMLSGRRIRIRH
jgi:uncharacterized membrane protein YgaE (UPF0421/DUF939 family)